MKRVFVPMLAMLLAACGQRAELRPPPGEMLPPAPRGAETRPSAEELLEVPTIARPERTEEVLTRSEEREPDPFDLPPT